MNPEIDQNKVDYVVIGGRGGLSKNDYGLTTMGGGRGVREFF